jgi:hypothetical protein
MEVEFVSSEHVQMPFQMWSLSLQTPVIIRHGLAGTGFQSSTSSLQLWNLKSFNAVHPFMNRDPRRKKNSSVKRILESWDSVSCGYPWELEPQRS